MLIACRWTRLDSACGVGSHSACGLPRVAYLTGALVLQLMLALFSSLGGLAALLLLAVPVGRYTVKYPDKVYLTVGCPGPYHPLTSQSVEISIELTVGLLW